MKLDFVSFDHLRVAIRSFSNNQHVCEPVNLKDLMLQRSPMGNPIINNCLTVFPQYILLEGLNLLHRANLILNSDVDQDT